MTERTKRRLWELFKALVNAVFAVWCMYEFVIPLLWPPVDSWLRSIF
jgi:hypothetical protein